MAYQPLGHHYNKLGPPITENPVVKFFCFFLFWVPQISKNIWAYAKCLGHFFFQLRLYGPVIYVCWLFFKKDDYITLSLRKSLLGQLLDIKKDLLQSTGTKTHILLYTACSLLTYSTSYAMLHVKLLRVRSVLQHMLQRKRKLVLLN